MSSSRSPLSPSTAHTAPALLRMGRDGYSPSDVWEPTQGAVGAEGCEQCVIRHLAGPVTQQIATILVESHKAVV